MSEKAPTPTLTVLDAEPMGFCEPDGDYCAVPGVQDEASGTDMNASERGRAS
ncbi:hypothetical protein ABZ379_26475 [Streptomyces canus]|uniref:hypothetical protein n=1 Tax=Streptomyces canus TaxID=58343 RepID=UPI0033E78CF2